MTPSESLALDDGSSITGKEQGPGRFGGDVSAMVPEAVAKRLQEKYTP